ncbi:hypothetical protein GCM10018952_75470 [Streptosporangium vulgare]
MLASGDVRDEDGHTGLRPVSPGSDRPRSASTGFNRLPSAFPERFHGDSTLAEPPSGPRGREGRRTTADRVAAGLPLAGHRVKVPGEGGDPVETVSVSGTASGPGRRPAG